MSLESTLSMIKPDAVSKNHIKEIFESSEAEEKRQLFNFCVSAPEIRR